MTEATIRNKPGMASVKDIFFRNIRRAIKEEKYATLKAILPMLQAKEDEIFVKKWKKYLEEEVRIMKDVPDWKVGDSVYHSGEWMPPTTDEIRPEAW